MQYEKTRRERLKSAQYLRLKKLKRLFLEKNLKFSKIFLFRKMSHSAKKCKRKDPLGFINIYSVAKYQKNSKGGLFWDIKEFSKKVAQYRKKIESGYLLVSSGFVGYVKKVKKNERETFLH